MGKGGSNFHLTQTSVGGGNGVCTYPRQHGTNTLLYLIVVNMDY